MARVLRIAAEACTCLSPYRKHLAILLCSPTCLDSYTGKDPPGSTQHVLLLKDLAPQPYGVLVMDPQGLAPITSLHHHYINTDIITAQRAKHADSAAQRWWYALPVLLRITHRNGL